MDTTAVTERPRAASQSTIRASTSQKPQLAATKQIDGLDLIYKRRHSCPIARSSPERATEDADQSSFSSLHKPPRQFCTGRISEKAETLSLNAHTEKPVARILAAPSDLPAMDSSKEATRALRFHFIRHAEAAHNLKDRISGEYRFHLHDPHLTPRGLDQIKIIESALPSKLSFILVSPMTRTLQTALIGLPIHLANRTPTIAWPDLKECGDGPSSTGSSPEEVRELCDSLYEVIDLSLVKPGWEDSEGSYDDLPQRVKRVKYGLMELALTLVTGGIWKGIKISLCGSENIDIAIVSHGTFLHQLMKKDTSGNKLRSYRNAEVRTYTALGDWSIQGSTPEGDVKFLRRVKDGLWDRPWDGDLEFEWSFVKGDAPATHTYKPASERKRPVTMFHIVCQPESWDAVAFDSCLPHRIALILCSTTTAALEAVFRGMPEHVARKTQIVAWPEFRLLDDIQPRIESSCHGVQYVSENKWAPDRVDWSLLDNNTMDDLPLSKIEHLKQLRRDIIDLNNVISGHRKGLWKGIQIRTHPILKRRVDLVLVGSASFLSELTGIKKIRPLVAGEARTYRMSGDIDCHVETAQIKGRVDFQLGNQREGGSFSLSLSLV